ncbi:hypothetical protein BCR33DRAFT_96628 [Rhizoclosmatium globosum]|uniref:Uncharacterized protein n=1 Tax=Rhizoclosmatium globosum TaxID=329046 RepID=A0A1Y2CK54_9FUNG|nr:hypothetical protein BCR33DRAFT_96628 [Rhizoclosmatium globosum]|eukprot:ORY47403.1 hypothetical protein BCR33DRAFT_96628 [Rhizoclosmatium globosum]
MIKTLKFEIDYTVEQYLIDAKAAAGYVTTDTGSSGGSQNGERSKFVKKAHSSAADLGNHMNQHPQHEKVEQYDQRPHSSYQAQNNNSSQNSSRQQRPNSSVPYKHGNTYPARSRNTWTPAESSPGWNEDEGVPKPTAYKPLAKRGGVLEGGPDDEDDVPETTSHPSTAGAAQRVSRDYYGSKSAAVSAAAPPAGLVDKEWGATANAPSNYGGQQPPPTTHNQYQNQYSRNYANQAPVNSAKSFQQDSRGGDGGRAVYQNQPAGFGSPTSNLKSTGYNGAPASRGGISASRGGRGRGDFYGGGGRGGYNHGGNYSGGMAGRGGFQRGASSQQEEWGQEMKLPQNETGGYSRN